MVAAPFKLTEPDRHADEWVPALCAQFSNATGWPLRYVPANHFSDIDSAVPSESCWQAEVHDGQQLVGRLRLDLPHEPHVDRSCATVSQLSNSLAELVEQVFTATRQSEVGAHEFDTLVDLRRSVPQGSEMLGAIK